MPNIVKTMKNTKIGTKSKFEVSKKCVRPTMASPKVMIVRSSKRSTKCGKLIMLSSKSPLKNGRNAPVKTATTLIQITYSDKLKNINKIAIT